MLPFPWVWYHQCRTSPFSGLSFKRDFGLNSFVNRWLSNHCLIERHLNSIPSTGASSTLVHRYATLWPPAIFDVRIYNVAKIKITTRRKYFVFQFNSPVWLKLSLCLDFKWLNGRVRSYREKCTTVPEVSTGNRSQLK